MEFNYITLLSIYITSLLVARHASCIPSKFLLPIELPTAALPPVSQILPSFPDTNSPLMSPTSSSLPSASTHQTSITSMIDDLTNTNLDIIVPKKVVDACKKTDHPTECSNSVAPLLDGKADPFSILQGETKAFDHALEVAKKDINKFSVDGDDQTTSTCKQMYENAREEISKAMELATKNDKYGVNIYLSAALTFIDTCKDEIPKDMKDDSTMVQTNKLLSDLASNSLALGNFAMGVDDNDY